MLKDKKAQILLTANRRCLQEVFQSHFPTPEKEISLREFVKFCKNLQILPDLLVKSEIKRILKQHGNSRALSFASFLKAIVLIAFQSFEKEVPSSEKLRMLFVHTKKLFNTHYHVSIKTDPYRESPKSSKFQEESPVDNADRRSFRKNKSFSIAKKHKIMRSGLIHTMNGTYSKNLKVVQSPSFSLKRNTPMSVKRIIDNSGPQRINRREHSYESKASRIEERKNKTDKLQDRQNKIVQVFRKFQTQNQKIFSGVQNKRLKLNKQVRCIERIKCSLFSKAAMKSIVFKAWKYLIFPRKLN